MGKEWLWVVVVVVVVMVVAAAAAGHRFGRAQGKMCQESHSPALCFVFSRSGQQ